MGNNLKRLPLLYKYCTISDEFGNTERIIKDSIIRLNSPDEFNDPFDLNILPRVDLHEEDKRKWIEDQLQNPLNNGIMVDLHKVLSSGDFKKAEVFSAISEGALSRGIRTHGIYCFSVLWDSVKMWAHYANKHKGLCIRFNINEKSSIHQFITNVEYIYEYPDVYINDPKSYDDFFKTKSVVWREEYEARLIKPKSCGQQIKLDEHEIEAIIFGIKSEEQEIQKVLNWINYRKSKPKLYKATMINRSYRIDIVPVDYCDALTAHKIVETISY